MSKTALVTGGTVALGSELVRHLQSCGFSVRVLSRRLPRPGVVPDDVRVIVGDIADDRALRSAVRGASIVFHLAAKLHINTPARSLEDEYRRVNVEGTRLLAKGCRSAGVGRLVFFSTVAVYGPSQPGTVLGEDSQTVTSSMYALTKRQAEEIALRTGRNDPDEPIAVILRLGAVYGPRMKGNYWHLLRALDAGLPFIVGDGRNRRTVVHARDVSRAAVLVAERPEAAGQIFNVTDGGVHTLGKIVEAIAEALGRRPPRFRVPLSLARAVAGLVDGSVRLIGRPPVCLPLLDKFVEDVAVSGAKIQRSLGFKPAFDLRSGWKDVVASLRERQSQY